MVQLLHKYDCSGCNACVQKCPKHCITMSEDEEGFLYPHIDAEVCIDCGLCEKVCPVIHQDERRYPNKCYAAQNPDENVRLNSSSGGIFTLLAEKIIDEGGVIFGASWNERWQVAHSYTETKKGIAAFQGSKYIQSIIGNTYMEAEAFLKAGRKVLFSGTPCQIAGLKKFLCKPYENLYTIDFICHGVPSPGVFRWCLQEEIWNHASVKGSMKNIVSLPLPITSIPKGDVLLPEGMSIVGIRFRDKSHGWKKFSFSLSLTEDDAEGKKIQFTLSKPLDEHPYLRGFLNDYYLRPSCHQCPAKQFKSGADITIADYWGYNSTEKIADDDKGTSAILVVTEKGQQWFDSIPVLRDEVPYDDILRINGAAEHSATDPYRAYFFLQKGLSFEAVIDKLTSNNFWRKVQRKLWFIYTNKKFK